METLQLEIATRPKTKSASTNGTKKNVFERINAHARREFRLINKKSLTIPVELYQRDESDGKVAREIALHFDQVAFGALTVIERKDGALHIADGGTRWSAIMHRPDIGNVPCMVFSNLSDQEACDTFLRINLNRRKLTTPQQQHGELFAGHDLAKRADAAEKSFAQYQIGFDSMSHLRACLRSQAKATDTLIKIMPEFAAQRHVTGRVFRAMVKLEELLNKSQDTLSAPASIKKLCNGFGNLDRILCAVIPPKGPGRNRSVHNATIIARALKIRLTGVERTS